jgi:type VI secretion system secreted protein Hcp
MSITVQLTGFKEFQALGFSWGTRHDPIAGMPPAQAQLADCHLTKEPDDNSPQLQLYANRGKPIAEGEITLKMDKGTLRVTLSDVYISSYQVSSGGDRPTESIALHFAEAKWKYS